LAANDETIRLLLDLGVSKENVQAVAKELAALKTAAVDTAHGYEVLERQVGEYDLVEDKVTQTIVHQTTALRVLGAETAKVSKATVEATSKVAGIGQSFLQTGRVIQDFTQGGFAGILNNIEGLTTALGLGSGLAGILTIVGTAAYIATPKIKEWWSGVTEGSQESIDKVKELEAELSKLMKMRPMQEKETAADVEFLIGEEGAEKLQRNIAAALAAKGEGAQQTPEEKRQIKGQTEQLEFLRANGGSDKLKGAAEELLRQTVFEAQQRITAENEKRAGEMLAKAPTSAASRRQIGRLLPGMKDALESTEPEFRERADAEADATEQMGKDLHAATQHRHKVQQRIDKRAAIAKRDIEKRTNEEIASGDAVEANRDRAEKAGVGVAAAGFKAARARVGGTDIDEEATAFAARMRGQGGDFDKFDRFRELNPAQQEARLRAEINRTVKARFPDMSAMQRSAVANSIAQASEATVNEQASKAGANAMRAGLDATNATQEAMRQLAVDYAQMAEQARMLKRNAKAIRPANQTNLNQGGPGGG
jgi:hypothetical protein